MRKSLHVQADRRLIRSEERSRRYLRVEVVAPRRSQRLRVSLGLVLDRSGSMDGAKLALAREGAIRAVRSLQDEDVLSVVIYNEGVVVLTPSRLADAAAKHAAEQMLGRIGATGNTDLCAGWLRGCEQVGLGLADGRLGRCLLLTDGLANEGITDRATIVQHAGELRRRGLTTSTLGVGRDFDEALLRQMAEAGGGNFYFAETPAQLSDFMAGEAGEALKTVAREAALVVELPRGASVSSPNQFPGHVEKTKAVFELGSLVSDQVLRLILSVEFPPAPAGARAPVRCSLRDAEGTLEASATQELFSYASSAASDAQPRDLEVTRDVASAYAARARQRAAELARAGAASEGRAALERTAVGIRQHALGDPMLLALASSLEHEATTLEQMESLDYKRVEYGTFGALRTRGDDGMTMGTARFTASATTQFGAIQPPPLARAPLFVTVVTSDQEGARLVTSAGNALVVADPRAFGFTVLGTGARILDPGRGAVLSREDELGLAYALTTSSDEVKIAFVRGALEDGSSSHWHAVESVAIVSLDGWEQSAGLGAEAFVAYQMLLHGSRYGRPGTDATAAKCCGVPGCWGELIDTREGMEEKLATGDLCPKCRGEYERAGVSVEQLQRLVAAVHRLAQAGVPS